jgi:hypothetical protein
MFEEIIAQLDSLGIPYEEDYDTGMLSIGVAEMDKSEIIEIIQIVNNSGLPFNVDETAVTVTGGDFTDEEDYSDELPEEMLDEYIG